MVTEWIKEVAVGPAHCAAHALDLHCAKAQNTHTKLHDWFELQCAHTVHKHMCVCAMGNPGQKCGSPGLPALNQHWDHQGHGFTDDYQHYPYGSPVCCWLHGLACLACGKLGIDL